MSTDPREGPGPVWYFTFGQGHTDIDGAPLRDRYVVIPGTAHQARARMVELFGRRWSHQYSSAAAAGVTQYGLTELPTEGRAPAEEDR